MTTAHPIDDAVLDATLQGQRLPANTLRALGAEQPVLLVFLRHYG